MLHLVLFGLLAIVVAGGLFALAVRFLPAGEQIAPAVRDEPPWELPPDRALRPEEIDAVRLPVALRGYRFAETDVLLDRLAAELRARDHEIARLRGEVDVAEPVDAPAQQEELPWVVDEPPAEPVAAQTYAEQTHAAEQPAADLELVRPDEDLTEALAVAEALDTATIPEGEPLEEATLPEPEPAIEEPAAEEVAEVHEAVAQPGVLDLGPPAAAAEAPDLLAVFVPAHAAVEPVTEQVPVVEEPVAEAPVGVAEEPTAEEPVVEQPAAEEPVGFMPAHAAVEPVVQEPVAEEPVAEEPVAEEPVAEEPVAEEPAGQDELVTAALPVAAEQPAITPEPHLDLGPPDDESEALDLLAMFAPPVDEPEPVHVPPAAPESVPAPVAAYVPPAPVYSGPPPPSGYVPAPAPPHWSAGAPPWAVAPAPWLPPPADAAPPQQASADKPRGRRRRRRA